MVKRKLYSKVIEEKKAINDYNNEVEMAKKNYKLDNEREVVIIKGNNTIRLLKLISYKIEGLIKITAWIFLMGIVSVGATVLINPSLRDQFMQIFK